jgi:hypothetical protein
VECAETHHGAVPAGTGKQIATSTAPARRRKPPAFVVHVLVHAAPDLALGPVAWLLPRAFADVQDQVNVRLPLLCRMMTDLARPPSPSP